MADGSTRTFDDEHVVKEVGGPSVMLVVVGAVTAAGWHFFHRRDEIVKAATRKESLALIVLGGAHDLTKSVRRVSGGGCEYIQVTTRQFKEFSGD